MCVVFILVTCHLLGWSWDTMGNVCGRQQAARPASPEAQVVQVKVGIDDAHPAEETDKHRQSSVHGSSNDLPPFEDAFKACDVLVCFSAMHLVCIQSSFLLTATEC